MYTILTCNKQTITLKCKNVILTELEHGLEDEIKIKKCSGVFTTIT